MFEPNTCDGLALNDDGEDDRARRGSQVHRSKYIKDQQTMRKLRFDG